MKIILFANTDWYLYNFSLSFAKALQAEGHAVHLMSPGGEYSNRLESAGFRWIPFPLSRKGTNPLAELGSVIRLIQVYRAEKPDLVHHYTIKCVLYGSMASRAVGTKLVINEMTGLGYLFTKSHNLLLTWLVKLLYRFALQGTHVIFQNRDDLDTLTAAELVQTQHTSLISGCGVDPERFKPAPEPEGIPIVMLAARMLWDKGVGEFVEAAKIVKQTGLAVRFVLVGRTDSDNPTSVTDEQLQRWQAEGWIEWWGWKDRMETIYPQASLVTLPSYREGVPTSLLEAAASGLALVATDVPGCREIVRQGENGLLVPAKDPAALAQAFITLLSDRELRRKMGHSGRDLVLNEFSTEKVITATLAIYEQLLQWRMK